MGRKNTATQKTLRSGLAGALFSTTQQRVLGLLFGQPDRSFYASEIIARVKAGSGSVQRELARLERSQLVQVRKVGAQKHYQANRESPIFHELVGIARKTMGLVEPIRDALAGLVSKISVAFVYGSVAKKSDTASSDIDLLIVGNELAYSDVYAALAPLSSTLGRDVNPTIYTSAELAKRRKSKNAFVTRILGQPKLFVIGSPNELGA